MTPIERQIDQVYRLAVSIIEDQKRRTRKPRRPRSHRKAR